MTVMGRIKSSSSRTINDFSHITERPQRAGSAMERRRGERRRRARAWMSWGGWRWCFFSTETLARGGAHDRAGQHARVRLCVYAPPPHFWSLGHSALSRCLIALLRWLLCVLADWPTNLLFSLRALVVRSHADQAFRLHLLLSSGRPWQPRPGHHRVLQAATGAGTSSAHLLAHRPGLSVMQKKFAWAAARVQLSRLRSWA